MNCLLCGKEENPGFKGSHIIPEFLTRSNFNTGRNKNKRSDSQIIISSESLTDIKNPYIRGVPEEQIPEQFRKDLDSGEQYNSISPETVDYLFCNACENLFGTFENYFSEHIYRKLIDRKAFKKNIQNRDFYEFKNLNLAIIDRFIASIIWRCSVTNYNDFQLSKKENKKLRLFLERNIFEFPFFYRLIVCDYDNFDNDKGFVYINYQNSNSACLFYINNFIIHLFFSADQQNQKGDLLLGTDRYFGDGLFLVPSNQVKRDFSVPILLNKEWTDFIEKLKSIYVKQTIEFPFNKTYFKQYQSFPNSTQLDFHKAIWQTMCHSANDYSANQEIIDQAVDLAISFIQLSPTASLEDMKTFVSNMK